MSTMDEISPKEFGEMRSDVKNLAKSFDRHTLEMKCWFKTYEKKLTDHMDDDKRYQDSADAHLGKIDDFILKLTSKWSLLVVIGGLIIWPVVMPLVREFIADSSFFEALSAYASKF